MRTFTSKSIWNTETKTWDELYWINNIEVSGDMYFRELEEEPFIAEEVKPQSDCDVCDECSQCDGCDEHCGRGNHDEVFELEDEDMCFCDECSEEREQNLIGECLDLVFDPESCIDCVISKIIDTAYRFKELGALEARSEMREFLED